MKNHELFSRIAALSLAVCFAGAHADPPTVEPSVPKASHSISFHDPSDGAFDLSDYLLNHSGFLPVPVVITDPMVGTGGGAMLMFFDESMAQAAQRAKSEGTTMAPPNITGVGGAATDNGTWFAGAFHFHTWGGDRYRYIGGLGKAHLEADFYGALNKPRAYGLDGDFLIQQLLFKMGESHWYIGPRYTFLGTKTTFEGSVIEGLNLEPRDRRAGKASVVVDYDSRDNMFYPSKGLYMEGEAGLSRDWLGSTQSFEIYNLRGYGWQPVGKAWVWGLRLDTQFARGDVPFYAAPFVSLRGVASGQYQDNNVVVGEVEGRYNVNARWSVLGFGGAGKAWGRWHDFDNTDTAWNAGLGFRYLIARKLGVTVGMDVARGLTTPLFTSKWAAPGAEQWPPNPWGFCPKVQLRLAGPLPTLPAKPTRSLPWHVPLHFPCRFLRCSRPLCPWWPWPARLAMT